MENCPFWTRNVYKQDPMIPLKGTEGLNRAIH